VTRRPADPEGAPAVVGLAADRAVAEWGPWHQLAALLPVTYSDAVARVGAIPVLVPPGAGSASQVLDRVDALVLAGGWDVDSSLYGQAPHPDSGTSNPERDDWENRLLAAAVETDLPVLAICRGMQLLNVHAGGTLIQHLPDVLGSTGHLARPGSFTATPVHLDPNSRLGALLGPSVVGQCSHHQAIDRVAPWLRAVGWADDGTIEAVEAPGREFLVGVQWHPEAGTDTKLFDALTGAALAHRSSPRHRRPTASGVPHAEPAVQR
jgi:putative glutamine amidotransferase